MVEEEDHVWHDGSYHKPVDVEEAENAAKEVTPGIPRIHLTRRETHHLARPLCDTARIRLRSSSWHTSAGTLQLAMLGKTPDSADLKSKVAALETELQALAQLRTQAAAPAGCTSV
jgi:hypothetical protein